MPSVEISANIRIMKIRNNEGGSLNVLLIPLILTTLFFLGALGFSFWAFMSRQDYKNNSDQKSAAAVEVAKKEVSSQKDNEFVEKEKYPLKSFNGPAELGSITLSYPKTWSGYISGGEAAPFFIFNPDVVSAGTETSYALRVTVESSPYNDVINNYDSQIQDGKLKATAYSLPKVSKVVGMRFDGEIEDGKPGSLVVIPLRDKTIKIGCEIPDRLGDFNKIILPNFSFTP